MDERGFVGAGVRAVVLGVVVCVLVGCGNKNQARDFNELIPRMMGASQRSTNPAEAAANMFNVTSADERRDAIAYLERKKYGHEEPYMRAYKLLTTDPHPMVRAQALRALGSSKDPRIVPWLVNGNKPDGTGGQTGLKDPVAEVRRDAAQALLMVTSPEAVPALIEGLEKDTDEQVRVACARALRHATEPRAIQALIRALDDKSAGVVYWASESLRIISGQEFRYDRQGWQEWFDQTYGKAERR